MSRELTIPELIETLTRLGRVLLVLFFLLVVTGVLVVWQRRRVRRQIAENEQDLVGETARVYRSMYAGERGQIVIERGGQDQLLPAVSSVNLRRGREVLIIARDGDTYRVSPLRSATDFQSTDAKPSIRSRRPTSSGSTSQ